MPGRDQQGNTMIQLLSLRAPGRAAAAAVLVAAGTLAVGQDARAGTVGPRADGGVDVAAKTPLSLSITSPARAPLGTLAKYTVVEAHGIPLTQVTWYFDGVAGGHALSGLANGTVQVWNTPGTHAVRVVASASGGRSAQATASTAAIGAPMASSAFTTCALTPAGEVRCWGYGNFGTLGNGSAANSAFPVVADGLGGMLGLAGGHEHFCGVTSTQTVACWGDDTSGQLGNVDTFHHISNPVPLPVGDLTGVVSIVAGNAHTCALKVDGTVACFGSNVEGELGIGSVGGTFVTPQPVVDLSTVVALSAGGGFFTCALKADGTVVCWGDNETGQLGDGTSSGTRRTRPGPVLNADGTPLGGVLALRSGQDHSCALLDDGNASVVCWGYNARNQVSGGASNVVYPATPEPGLTGVSSLSMTGSSSCAAAFDGSFKCWGDNGYAESDGKGVPGTTVTPPAPFRGLQAAKQPLYGSGGNGFLCVLTKQGGARCVGLGVDGELGQGAFATAYVLQTVAVPAGTFWP
jgi:alpha-tubulin suppressor-like RCC1 family protein